MNKLAAVNIGQVFGSPYGTGKGFGNIVSLVLGNAVALAGFVLFLIILFGGISIIQGAGENNPQKTQRGKEALTAAIIGFIIIFSTFWIARLVEFITGVAFTRFV